MRQVRMEQTKSQEFKKNIKALKEHIYNYRPETSDEELKSRLDAVLKMMFFEDDLETKKRFKKDFDEFMKNWLLTKEFIRRADLLVVLKMMQDALRAGKKRYGKNIAFYFNPDVYVLSFKPRSLFQRREKNIFMKQMLQNYKQIPQAVQYVDATLVPSSKPVKGPTKPPKPVADKSAQPKIPQSTATSITDVVSQSKPADVGRKALLADITKSVNLKAAPQQKPPQQKPAAPQQKPPQQKPAAPQQKTPQSKPAAPAAADMPAVGKKGLLADITRGIKLKAAPAADMAAVGKKGLLADITRGVKLKTAPAADMPAVGKKGLLADITRGVKLKTAPQPKSAPSQQKPAAPQQKSASQGETLKEVLRRKLTSMRAKVQPQSSSEWQ